MSFANSLSGAIGGAISGLASGDWMGALAGAGMGLLSGASQDLNNIEARKAATRMNRMQLAAWHMQNEYNSPVEQMARLKEAGLNPMLVYGGGNVPGNSSTSIGSMSTHANEVNTMAGIQGIQALEDLKQTSAQTKNTQQSTLQSEANTLATYQDISNMQTANKIQQAQLEQEQQAVKMGAMDLEVAERIQKARLGAAHFGAVADLLDSKSRFYDSNLNYDIDNKYGGREIKYGWKAGVGAMRDVLSIAGGLADTQASFSRASAYDRMSRSSPYVPRYRNR